MTSTEAKNKKKYERLYRNNKVDMERTKDYLDFISDQIKASKSKKR